MKTYKQALQDMIDSFIKECGVIELGGSVFQAMMDADETLIDCRYRENLIRVLSKLDRKFIKYQDDLFVGSHVTYTHLEPGD